MATTSTVRVGCACGRTDELPATSLLAVRSGAGDPDSGETGSSAESAGVVAWVCTGCGDLASRPVGWLTLTHLVAAGLTVLREDVTDPRPPHPETAPDGPALTTDDLLDLHERLAAPDSADAADRLAEAAADEPAQPPSSGA